MNQIEELESSTFVDFDTVFRPVTDKDYDLALGGVTRQSFCQSYHEWLVCCNKHRPENEVCGVFFIARFILIIGQSNKIPRE